MKRLFISLFFISLIFSVFSEETSKTDIHHNPWELIIYRPHNNGDLNTVRCWIQLLDEEGNDVTYSAAKATYEWIDSPDRVNNYQKTYYLSGGMAMHLNLKPGKYQIRFYTPVEKQDLFETENTGVWESNIFYYNTDNPTKVLFVIPTANDNGFYNGGWWIDYKAPKYVKKRALPHITE